MTNTGRQLMNRAGYTEHVSGYSGPFSWFRTSFFPGKWLVVSHETSFAKDTTARAVTDDFGNLVRVPA